MIHHGGDYIRVYEGALGDTLCDQLLTHFKHHQHLGLTWMATTVGGMKLDTRLTESLCVPTEGNLGQEMASQMEAVKQRYMADMGLTIPKDSVVSDHPSLQRYPADVGFYKIHSDGGPKVHRRIFTLIGYLNTVAEGGGTHFDQQGITVRPRRGTVVAFPANWMYTHEGLVPVGEDKYIVTNFHEMGEKT